MEYVVGVDEVGRGALAGPVTLGLVALPVDFPKLTYITDPNAYRSYYHEFIFVRDSKRISEKKRLHAHQLIMSYDFPRMTLSATNHHIDEFGIGSCLKHLLYLGLLHFAEYKINKVFVDGRLIIPSSPSIEILKALSIHNQSTIVFSKTVTLPPTINEDKADDKYLSIALASCFAKVTRDEYMKKLSSRFPIYDWHNNKGYGTASHCIAIKSLSDNPYLRRTFISNLIEGI